MAPSLKNAILPALIFLPTSAILFKYLFVDLLQTGVFTTKDDCPEIFAGKSQYQLHYLGGYLPKVEHIACILVSFFHPLLRPGAEGVSPFIRDFAVALAPCAVVPFFEAYRNNSKFFPGFAMIMGLIYQSFTVGVTFPIYWFILFALGPKRAQGFEIKRGAAESVLFPLSLPGSYSPST
ncbi:hypothetical protein M422DRAFT_268196 [Sphaerobolus stellatus SS14]|uniref:Uncharacterized protein n=1 Tax=Sphaerobolus stellatus (strain SS14) TaxID=990650 RepID=A0A0C9UYW6_SPHS4|nr:hypothetical protein M422DRAFT_268196 [Sphaerobolus stellatus SS14]